MARKRKKPAYMALQRGRIARRHNFGDNSPSGLHHPFIKTLKDSLFELRVFRYFDDPRHQDYPAFIVIIVSENHIAVMRGGRE